MKIVIVGGVAGGASAAARARRLDERAEIIILERGPDPSFANCGLPYYIGGKIESRDALLVTPRQRLIDRYALDVRVLSEVTDIDREKKTVRIHDLDKDSTYEESYDKLILSPGASPIRPPITGIDLPGIYSLRDLKDADLLLELCTTSKRATIVGAGFIGIEMAENLVRQGIETTMVELADQVLPPWDAEMVAPFAENLKAQGIDIRLSDSAKAFEQEKDGLTVRLNSGAEVAADFVVLCVGVRPENKLAVEAGLEIGERGGIVVNSYQQTSDPDIYAAGDAVQVVDAIRGEPIQIPLGGPANRQGRIAADHIFGRDSRYRGTQGTAIVGAFGCVAAMTGCSEKWLRKAGLPCEKIYLHPGHHAGYYPGAAGMSIKLLFCKATGKILGAQIVGTEGVDKRIDVLATAIQADMNVYDLEEAELAYAPQFGSAKDPINMAGFIASGVLRGDQPIEHVDEILVSQNNKASQEPLFLLDVRSQEEFLEGSIPGAINIPIEELRSRLDELPKDRLLHVFCKVGMRGYLAQRILMQHGFECKNLSGGYTTYTQYKLAKPDAIATTV